MALISDGVQTPKIWAPSATQGTSPLDAYRQYAASRTGGAKPAVILPGIPDPSAASKLVSGGSNSGGDMLSRIMGGYIEYGSTRAQANAPVQPATVDGTAKTISGLTDMMAIVLDGMGAKSDQPSVEYMPAFWNSPEPVQNNSKTMMMIGGAAALGLAILLLTKG